MVWVDDVGGGGRGVFRGGVTVKWGWDLGGGERGCLGVDWGVAFGGDGVYAASEDLGRGQLWRTVLLDRDDVWITCCREYT